MARRDAEVAADIGDHRADRSAANLRGDLLRRWQADPRVKPGDEGGERGGGVVSRCDGSRGARLEWLGCGAAWGRRPDGARWR